MFPSQMLRGLDVPKTDGKQKGGCWRTQPWSEMERRKRLEAFDAQEKRFGWKGNGPVRAGDRVPKILVGMR